MTELITGAAGFIGDAVYERLLARSEQLVGIDNLKPGHCGVEHFVYASSSSVYGGNRSSSNRMTQTDTTAPPPQSTRTHLLGFWGCRFWRC
jgi:nucleoside-diphosphate-sugar epimerase